MLTLWGTDQGVVYDTDTPDSSGSITQDDTVDESDVALVFASIDVAGGNYLRLKDGSPAVNVGNNDYLNNGTPDDLDDDIIMTDAAGKPRILNGTVDLGAYESGMAPQTIMFTSADAGVVGTDIELMATASSGLTPVSFAITQGDAFATLDVNGTTLSLIGAGTVTITATQVGNADYEEVTQTQDITVSKDTQTIMFTSDAVGAVSTDIELMATASSGLDVTFAITEVQDADGNVVTGVAADAVATLAVNGTTLSLMGIGEVVITATQAGNASYVAATQTQTITVSQGMQTIRFTSDAAGVISTDIELMATASSGLDVTFMITAETLPDGSAATTGEVATLSSTTLSLISAGKVTITATQAGNANYAMATQTQEIAVSAIPLTPQTITFMSTDAGNVGVPITLVATATSTLPVIFAITTQTRTTGTGGCSHLRYWYWCLDFGQSRRSYNHCHANWGRLRGYYLCGDHGDANHHGGQAGTDDRLYTCGHRRRRH